MTRRTKRGTAIYEYLDKQGVLSKDEAVIKGAKRAYWKDVRNEWRRRKRADSKQFIIWLDKDELKTIKEACKANRHSITRYLRKASLAYAQVRYLVPDVLMVGEIRQSIVMMLFQIQKLANENKIGYKVEREIVKVATETYEQVHKLFTDPKLLTDAIKDELKNNKQFKDDLLLLIKKNVRDN